MFDPIRFFSPSSLFDINPGSNFSGATAMLIFCGILLIVAIGIFVFLRIKKINPPLKKLLRPIPLRLEVFALVGILLVLFRLSAAYYLSMRFFLLIWGISFIWYLVLLSQKIRLYPQQLKDFLTKEEAKKYLFDPKNKKKRK